MNNDDYKERQYLRNLEFQKNMNSADVKCKDVVEYAKKQNTFYDPKNNLMLYGIDSNMAAAGVSNGTCNQVNPLIYTDRYKCGAGTAGGNPCVQDMYNYRYQKLYKEADSSSIFEHFNGLGDFTSVQNSPQKIVIFCLLVLLLVLYFGCV